MRNGRMNTSVEQQVLHDAGTDIPGSLFSEVTAAQFPPATKTLPCAPNIPLAPKEKTGGDLPQSAVDTWYG